MLIHWKLSWKWKKEQHIKCLRLILHLISIDCKPYSYSENFYNIFSVNEKVTFYSMCKISKFSNKSMSQLSFSRHNFGKQSVLPFPKKLKKLAHPRLFYHPMAAEGSTVIPHQVTESSTEKRQNTDFFFTSKTKHKQNNCFPGICNKKFDTYHLYLPIILQLYFIRSWFIEEILNSI